MENLLMCGQTLLGNGYFNINGRAQCLPHDIASSCDGFGRLSQIINYFAYFILISRLISLLVLCDGILEGHSMQHFLYFLPLPQ
jgi:hypothetical protein